MASADDSMMITGNRMNANIEAPSETYILNGQRAPYEGNYLKPGNVKHGGTAIKTKTAHRGSSNDRKSSVGGDPNSPFPQGGIVGNTIGLNQ